MPHHLDHTKFYRPARFQFTHHQIHKILKGNKVRLQKHQIGKGEHVVMLHPLQHEKISRALEKEHGVDLHLSPGEMYSSIHSGIEGTGFLDVLKDAGNWLWNNVGKPVLGTAADAGADALKGIVSEVPIVGSLAAPLIDKGRAALKGATGVGLKKEHKPRKKKEHGNGLYL